VGERRRAPPVARLSAGTWGDVLHCFLSLLCSDARTYTCFISSVLSLDPDALDVFLDFLELLVSHISHALVPYMVLTAHIPSE
jgi:hypothetical protein